ncbi:3-dehydroquinate synthase [Salimicrobium halophilum]|uniref:3-dehydroquinate synthase n=1 Tax=Salimicrobium halophilum TaxID=86666 RepID=A0A1G8Q0C0_9BACI|nr:3-dehydroquinate synthase [Salimicrobium halophilum]SDI98219.1 3-dehydroquinate synthase [Salimicrobium halophilum]
MERLHVQTPGKSYDVVLEEGLRHRLSDYIESTYSKILIITDENVAELYLEDVRKALGKRGHVYEAVIPAGEASKSFRRYEELLDHCVEAKLDRNSLILALGGGMVGDLAGFVAASYLRGIAFIQVPTSILAHDSSVGGKVAINHSKGKNLIGAFHHPEKVLYDTETTDSLPEKEKRSGYGEVVKHALLSDEGWFREVMNRTIKDLDTEEVKKDLIQGIRLKARIVGKDEKERGIRKHLNLGHTLGHAIESELHYGSITHGEAVVIGTLFALRLSNLDEPFALLMEWAKDNGYPLGIMEELEERNLVDRMKVDKKAQNDQIHYCLLSEIGSPFVTEVEEEELLQSLQQFKSEVIQ